MKISFYKILLIILFTPLCINAQDASEIFNTGVKSVGLISDGNSGIGSGFFINKNIFITNYHVLSRLDTRYAEIKNKNGKLFTIKKVIDEYPDKDLAIIMTDQESKDFLKISKLSDINVGDKVFAIGNPSTWDQKVYEFTITDGIINNITYENIQIEELHISSEVILHSAAINPGNSGGPLLNSNSELIGINSFYKYGNNLYFAIHVSELIEKFNDHNLYYIIGSNEVNEENIDYGLDSNKKSDNTLLLVVIVGGAAILLVVFTIIIRTTNRKKDSHRIPQQQIPYIEQQKDYTYERPAERPPEYQTQQKAYLNFAGRNYEVTPNGIILGRDKLSDLVINDRIASRRHCRVSQEGDRYIITDFGSKNGTMVNSEKTSTAVLKNGDIIKIGNNKVYFKLI